MLFVHDVSVSKWIKSYRCENGYWTSLPFGIYGQSGSLIWYKKHWNLGCKYTQNTCKYWWCRSFIIRPPLSVDASLAKSAHEPLPQQREVSRTHTAALLSLTWDRHDCWVHQLHLLSLNIQSQSLAESWSACLFLLLAICSSLKILDNLIQFTNRP